MQTVGCCMMQSLRWFGKQLKQGLLGRLQACALSALALG